MTTHDTHLPPRRKAVKAWIEAMRLRTLPVSVAGVVAGCGAAASAGSFRPLPAILCLVFAILAQIASNFANEYYDYANGLDKRGREGFRRGVTEGDISPEAMKRATYGVLALAAITGLSLVCFGGWWLIPIGAAIAIFALAYSTGPYPLSHHGLGDIAVIIFFGIVPVMFTSYVQTGSFSRPPFLLPLSIAIGLMAANVLIVNNYRDMEADKAVNKCTTVVIFGRKAMLCAYTLSGLIALTLIGVIIYSHARLIVPFLILLCVIAHQRLCRALYMRRGAKLNPLLGMTAILLLAVAITTSIILAI